MQFTYSVTFLWYKTGTVQILDSGLNSKLDPGLDVPHSQLGLN